MGFKFWSKILLVFSRLVKRKKNAILIFNGRKKSLVGNQLYFVKYLKKIGADYTVISSSRSLIKTLNLNGINASFSYSLIAFRKFFSFKITIVSHGMYDVKPYCLDTKSQLVINIWHGSPVKKIGKFLSKSNNEFFDFSYITVNSEIEGETMMKAFEIGKEKILKTGLCKNDSLLSENRNPKKEIIYLPTFRDWKDSISLFPFADRDLKQLDTFLNKIGYKLIVKPHVNSIHNEEFDHFKKIKIIDSNYDIQELILNSSILITDYSGVFIDYLLLNRPIIFYPYDLKRYTKERGFIYNYKDITPGYHVKSQNEMIKAINQYVKNPSIHSNERQILKNKFHDHFDAKACERIYTVIKEYFKKC